MAATADASWPCEWSSNGGNSAISRRSVFRVLRQVSAIKRRSPRSAVRPVQTGLLPASIRLLRSATNPGRTSTQTNLRANEGKMLSFIACQCNIQSTTGPRLAELQHRRSESSHDAKSSHGHRQLLYRRPASADLRTRWALHPPARKKILLTFPS